MRGALLALAASVVSVALAGCTTPAEGEPPGDGGASPPIGNLPGPGDGLDQTSPEDNATAPEVLPFSGTATGATAPGVVAFSLPGGSNGDTFELGEGATGLVLEVHWNGSEPLNLFLAPPCEASGPLDECPDTLRDAPGQSPARIVVEDPALLALTGTWGFAAYPNASPQGVPWQGWVSMFRGGAVPEGYSAAATGP
jgi:hypothetical protein